MQQLNIAVIGSGISGLSAAWLLSKAHKVTLYETGSHAGGHANTTDVETSDGPVAVDTGFIVYNELNYPNLTALFQHLDVSVEATEMSFALSLSGGGYEYAGSGFNGFFGQRKNLVRPGHWQLLRDISRFFRTAEARLGSYPAGISLGAFLTRERYSETFVQDHIVPMGAAIWSTSMTGMLGFPARSFVDFYANHGMLQFRDRPSWRTVTGGSRSYVRKLLADSELDIQLENGIQRLVRHDEYVHVEDENGTIRPFDHVVIATHADTALSLLDEPTNIEASHLGAFRYQMNRAVLHRDRRWMPRRPRLWSSWNYMKQDNGYEEGLCLTYWMNRLQNLSCRDNLFVTLNPTGEIHPKSVIGTYDYTHPVFNASAMKMQETLWDIQGKCRTWFCGSYFGYGFHEDGAQSGLAVAEQLGGVRRPWSDENESGRIASSGWSHAEAAE